MKIKKLLLGLSILSSLSLGVAGVVGVAAAKKEPVKTEAATATTVYYAVPSSVVGSYTVKLNINRQGDAENWATYTMSRDGTKTQGGNLLYKCEYTDLYDGVGKMQFQLYEGSTWKSQQEPISSWTTVGTYNGKVYVHNTGWAAYNPDVTYYTVTKYKVLDGASPVSIGSEQVAAGSTYGVPANRYEAGYSFEGWYTTSACTTNYTARAINANTGIYAKYTSGTWSGTLHVDLNNSGWADGAANYAILFMDKTTYPSEVDGWSSYVTGTAAGHRLVEVPYSLQFEPKLMTVVRYNTSKTQSDWNSNKWTSVWNQTKDVDFSQTIRIGNTTDQDKQYAYGGFPKLIGGVGEAWNDIAYLESVKENGSNNAEFYKLDVTLAANTAFKVQVGPYNDGDYYATYTPHSSISGRFSGGGSNNIVCNTAGTYAFYFDSYAHTLYITKEEIAEADEWAQYFNSHVGCDPTGQANPSGWSSCAAEYAKLSDDAKDYVYGETANPSGTYTQIALVTYDYAVAHHASLTKFVTNHSGTPRNVAPVTSPAALVGNVVNNNNVIAIVVIISVVAVTSIGAYFFVFKKRKQD